jgi:hypothetical protein
MTLLNWYDFSASSFFNWLGKVFDRSFHAVIKLGWLPDAFYITVIAALFLIWMGMLRKFDMEGKDKGLID